MDSQQTAKTVMVIVLRTLWPVIGGAAIMSEDELQIAAGGLVTVGFVVYHIVQRIRGKARAEKAGVV